MKEERQHADARRANKKRKITVMGVALLTSFITTFMGSALNLSIPSIDAEFEAGSRTVNWVITAYMLSCTGLAIPFGYFADRGRQKEILRLGIAIFTIASILAVFFSRIGLLILFRGLQGAGAAMIFSSNIPILIAAFDEDQRGRVLGYAACANYLGLSAGPVLGGVLNTNFGWRSIFIVTAVISGIALAGAWLFAVKKEERAPEPAARNGSQVCRHARSKSKSLRHYLALLRENPTFVCSNLAAWINYGANFSVTYLLSLYLQSARDCSARQAGFLLAAQTVVMAVFSPLSGRLSDKLSAHKLSAIGMGICAVSLGMLSFLTQTSSIWYILGSLMICGFGFSLFASPNSHAVMSAVNKEDFGMAASILSTMRSFGHTGCMLLITGISGIYLRNIPLQEADPLLLLKMMRLVFCVFLIFCILGFYMAKKRKMW